MAINFSYRPSGITLTAELPTVAATTDADAADITICDNSGHTLLSERYYAYDKLIFISDLRSLLESDMRNSSETLGKYTIFATDLRGGTASVELNVIYCDRLTHGNTTDILLRNFLTTHTDRRVPPGAELTLYFFVKAKENCKLNVNAALRLNGEVKTLTYGSELSASADALRKQSITHASLIKRCADAYHEAEQNIELLFYTVTIGERQVRCWVDKTLTEADAFFFRNDFNLPDCIYLAGVTTAKTSVDRQTASVGGISSFYDQKSTRTYELTSRPLTEPEAEAVDSLTSSYKVSRRVPPCSADSPTVPLLITESTCEVSNKDDELNTVKLTWRYTDNRPLAKLDYRDKTFTSPFDTTFS